MRETWKKKIWTRNVRVVSQTEEDTFLGPILTGLILYKKYSWGSFTDSLTSFVDVQLNVKDVLLVAELLIHSSPEFGALTTFFIPGPNTPQKLKKNTIWNGVKSLVGMSGAKLYSHLTFSL